MTRMGNMQIRVFTCMFVSVKLVSLNVFKKERYYFVQLFHNIRYSIQLILNIIQACNPSFYFFKVQTTGII